MALEKSIIKAQIASTSTYEFKPPELNPHASTVAKSFVNEDAFISSDFKISELVAEQAGILKLENEAQQDHLNAQVLERLKEVQEKAYQEGYQLGLIDGTEKAFQEAKAGLLERLQAMESMLKRLEDLKTHLLVDNEAALVNLVFLVAKKIAVRDLEENRGAVWEILQHVIGEVQANERVVVRVCTQDLTFLEGLQEKSGQKIESLQRVKFLTDDAIKPGGCLIETEFGNVNATLEERVERMWQTLQARIPHKPTVNE